MRPPCCNSLNSAARAEPNQHQHSAVAHWRIGGIGAGKRWRILAYGGEQRETMSMLTWIGDNISAIQTRLRPP